jgi:hypothetical protein
VGVVLVGKVLGAFGFGAMVLALGCSSHSSGTHTTGAGGHSGEAGTNGASGDAGTSGGTPAASGGASSGGASSGGASSGGQGGSSGGASGANTGGAGGGSAGATDGDPCPPSLNGVIRCASDCGSGFPVGCQIDGPSGAGCARAYIHEEATLLRLPPAAETCKICSGTVAVVEIEMTNTPNGTYRYTVSPPWSLIPPPSYTQSCGPGAQCMVHSITMLAAPPIATAVTTDLDAGPRNVTVEFVPSVDGPATCP